MITGLLIFVENEQSILDGLTRAKLAVMNLTKPLTLIMKDWYQSEAALFQLSGPGNYPDLKKTTKTRKERMYGRVYPILKASGALARSVTNPADTGAVNQIVNGNQLLISTRVKSRKGFAYPMVHQQGKRPFMFIGPESQFSLDSMNGRPQRWNTIMKNYILGVLGESGEPVKEAA